MMLRIGVIVIGLSFLAIGMKGKVASSEDDTSLRRYADQMGVYVGTIFEHKTANLNPEYGRIVAREYNSFVSPTFMRSTEPEPGQFNFRSMDRDIQFARKYGMKLFGAALLYKAKTTPEWVMNFVARPQELDQAMKRHIQTMIQHGGDTYYAWEVVNEPLTTANAPWGSTLGREEYIAKAYRYAREANPNALLVINQAFGHGGIDRSDVDEFFHLVKRLKASHVPIDVAGIEMHLQAQELRPNYLNEFRYFLDRAREAGVKSEITEMDVYQGPESFSDGLTRQKQIFQEVVSTCLQDSNCIGFYTWGLSDADSWLRNKPNNRLPDAKPLLFDETYHKKPAYFGVLDAFKGSVGRR